MYHNNFTNYDTPTQLAERRKQNYARDRAQALLKIVCDRYSVFLRSDDYDNTNNESLDRQIDYIYEVAKAAMEVYHPGLKEFLEQIESE